MRVAAMFALKRMGLMVLYGLLGPPLIVGVSLVLQVVRTHVDPLQKWFYPMHLHVPDFCSGDDPHIIYDRLVLKPFAGSYHTHFTSVTVDNELGFPICDYQSGVFEYYPKDEVRATPRLSEFMGRSCVLLGGRYRVEATWHPLRSGYVDETSSLVSNVFTVLPQSNPQCKGVNE